MDAVTPKLYGITGKAGSGKDTLASRMLRTTSLREGRTGGVISLADPIKELAAEVLSSLLPDYTASLLDAMDRTSYREVKEQKFSTLFHKCPAQLEDLSLRGVWQDIGSSFRNSIHPDVWALRCLAKIDVINNVNNNNTLIIVPDVRYDNEATLLKQAGATIIKVVRDGIEEVRAHESEGGISTSLVDIVIHNNGSIQDLDNRVKEFLCNENEV